MIPTPQDEKPRGDALVEDEVKQLIIDVVQLEDITLADIDTDAPLFVDGLGLDFIDALERALHKRYGISLSGDAVRRHHRCVFAYVI
jgi:acyl carrier protein